MISNSIPLQQINDAFIKASGVNLFVLRTDLNHAYISGNKLYKLKYNLREAKKQNKKILLTFGGAFSNHIAAIAAAGKECNFQTIGVIRGDETEGLNSTLKYAASQGMQLYFVSRTLYRDKKMLNEYVHEKLHSDDIYFIPEGGANELGIKGCTEILNSVTIPFDRVCCACGTGTTLTGIILSLKEDQKALGFQALKATHYIRNEVGTWLQKSGSTSKDNWSVNEDFHFGGYAKSNPELFGFIQRFERENSIPLDPVYTAKMFYGIYTLIENGHFQKGETVIAIHTGGLQGNAGFLFH